MARHYSKRGKSQRGQEMAEVVGGLILLIPILLAMLDLAVYVLGNQVADKYTKAAARAAANTGNSTDASTAANAALGSAPKSGFITSVAVTSCTYNAIPVNACTGVACTAAGSVTVQLATTMQLPVPIPWAPTGWNNPIITTSDTEAVVSMPTQPACAAS